MRVRSIRIQDYKRFAESSTLYVTGPLIAVAGPNEAGKTTLLEALGHLSEVRAFSRREFTDRTIPDWSKVILSARFGVDEEDREALGDLLEKRTDYTLTVERRAGEDHVRTGLDPKLTRDLRPRQETSSAIRKLAQSDVLRREETTIEGEAEGVSIDDSFTERAVSLADSLDDAGQDLSDAQRQELRVFADELEHEFANDRVAKATGQLRKLADLEDETHPNSRARKALLGRMPRFLRFDEDQRQLGTNYEWAELPSPTPALDNLFNLAEVDYDAYRTVALDRERRDELQTLERQANKTLREKFAVWTQDELSLQFRADHEGMQLQILDHKTLKDVPFDERSAGLRSFVAFIAFASRYGGDRKPVLLVDEAETHLHYGGQADLIKVFERQQVAQAIIYTTHSIGCLPEDLGTTIRVVRPLGSERSRIENSFWSGGAGLTPLMLAMGAHALAFTPARLAVLTEGPSDTILLPALFRTARAPRYAGGPLGFQIAPGVSNVSGETAADLELEAGNVVYLFDVDAGGRRHGDKLADRAKLEGRVMPLGEEEGLCVEDFVNRGTLAEAFNKVLTNTRNTSDQFPADGLPDVARPAFWDAWCDERGIERVSKTLVAQRVIELGFRGRTLLQTERKQDVRRLYERLRKKLGVPKPS